MVGEKKLCLETWPIGFRWLRGLKNIPLWKTRWQEGSGWGEKAVFVNMADRFQLAERI